MQKRTATELQALLERAERDLRLWKSLEEKLSEAYLRLRAMIPGAFDTPNAPTTEQVWHTTEAALQALVDRLKAIDTMIVEEWHKGVREFHLKPGSATEAVVSSILDRTRGVRP